MLVWDQPTASSHQKWLCLHKLTETKGSALCCWQWLKVQWVDGLPLQSLMDDRSRNYIHHLLPDWIVLIVENVHWSECNMIDTVKKSPPIALVPASAELFLAFSSFMEIVLLLRNTEVPAGNGFSFDFWRVMFYGFCISLAKAMSTWMQSVMGVNPLLSKELWAHDASSRCPIAQHSTCKPIP